MKSISSNIIAEEAVKMGFKIKIIDKRYDIFSITGNGKTRIFKNIDCGVNTWLWVRFANQKKLTYALLEKKKIPVPKSISVNAITFDVSKIQDLGLVFPLVVKPGIGEHWDWVVVNIQTEEELIDAIQYASKYKNQILIQEFFKWEDYRIIVINHKFVAAMKRIPAHIIGDGINSIENLIREENNNPARWEWHQKGLSKIFIDEEAKKCLEKQDYTLESIPNKDCLVYIRKNANLSTGGISVDVTNDVHPEIRKICEKASKAVCLKVCWIDYLSENISKPLNKQTGGIIEINHTPGLRGHHFPAIGKPRNIAKRILKLALK